MVRVSIDSNYFRLVLWNFVFTLEIFILNLVLWLMVVAYVLPNAVGLDEPLSKHYPKSVPANDCSGLWYEISIFYN